jgi:hypothetical protein
MDQFGENIAKKLASLKELQNKNLDKVIIINLLLNGKFKKGHLCINLLSFLNLTSPFSENE